MKNSKMSTFLRNTGAVAALVTTSALATGFLAPSASAQVSMVPQEEGEINVGLGCLVTCISDTTLKSLWIDSIVSIGGEDSSSGTRSRLFVDNFDDTMTTNTYNGGLLGTAILLPIDAGTRPKGYWFRPSETNADGSVGEEQGQLEVGTYKFTFTKIIPELKIAYFDTETTPTTGFLDTDGTLVDGVNLLPTGPNGNTQYQILKNVSFITLKLGKDTDPGNGDGVDFQLYKKAVPEPSAAVGLGALGLMGIFGLRKRNKKSV